MVPKIRSILAFVFATILTAFSGRAADRAQRNTLASLESFDSAGQVIVRWTTGLENGLIGYDLLRENGGTWVKVNTQLIVAENVLEGGTYQVTDPGARPNDKSRYRVLATLDTGLQVELGSREVAPVPPGSTDAIQIGTEGGRSRAIGVKALTVGSPGDIKINALTGSVDLPNSPLAIKISTTVAGMHFVSSSSLATLLGQSAATVDGWITSGRLGLWNQTNKVTYIPGNGWVVAGQTGPGLFFYAEGIRNNYTTTNAYWLAAGTNTFLVESGGSPTPQTPGQYTAIVTAESDSVEARSTVQEEEDDFWFWTRLTANSASDTWNPAPQFTFDSMLIRDPAISARLKIRLYGASRTSHLVKVTLTDPNNKVSLLGNQTFSGIGPFEAQFTFPSDLLGVGANKLTVQALLDSGVHVSQFYVDGYDLTYPRTYNTVGVTSAWEGDAQGSTVNVGTGKLVMTVGGFGSAATAPNVLVFQVTDIRNPRRVTGMMLDKVGTWRASINPTSIDQRYVFLQPLTKSAQAFPAGISLVTPSHLSDPTNRAAYLIVAHASLTAGADQLANYRSSQFRTKVVQLEDIYNEFSYGVATPHAVSRFLATAYAQWSLKPRYLVLMGDGTYDYRNLQAAGDNFVPPLMIKTPYGLNTSDSLYGDVLGTGEPRIIVGRFPVKTIAEGGVLLAKIQNYERRLATSPLKALLLADQPDSAGDFIENINEVESFLAPTYSSTKVHPDYAPAAINQNAITNLIKTTLNTGVDLLNYMGHGAVDRFGTVPYIWVTQPPVTTSVTVNPSLSNGAELPLVIAMTCVAGMYSSPGYTCLAEGLLRADNAGAVAVVSPTGLSQDADAVWINRRIMELLACNTGSRLGDLVAQSFSLYNDQNPPPRTPVWIYNILGDPALKLASVVSSSP